ncbi:MAG: hypothetical protein LBF27_30715 [Sphingobacterium sp.]|jgi:hypothetical protein|nr:hypothetical protein [Sphingobacterium sp.]
MKNSIFIVSLILTGVISCKSPQPMLNNLYHGQIGNQETDLHVIDVKVGIVPYKASAQIPEQPKLLWDLRDSLSYHLLKEISAKTKSPEEIISLMSKPIYPLEKESPKELPTDYTEYKVRLVFSNIKRYFIDPKFTHPNTRLAYLNTSVSIPHERQGIVFKSIDKLENEFEEIDRGDISRNQSATFNSKLTATGQIGTSVDNTNTSSSDKNKTSSNTDENTVYDKDGNIIGKINNSGNLVRSNSNSNTTTTKSGASANISGEVGYINTETINEAKRVKSQRMKAGFSFSPTEIVVSQEGRQNGDITNNVFVDATIKFTGQKLTDDKPIFTFKNLFNDRFQPTPAEEINFDNRVISYVLCTGSTPLNLNVKFEGLLRAVDNLKGQTGENDLEFDDKVTMYHLKERAGTEAVLDPIIFCKYVYKVTAKTKEGKTLYMRISWRGDSQLYLFSEEKPEEFIRWLELQIINGNLKNLSTNRFQLYFPISGGGNLDIVKDNMTAQDLAKLRELKDWNLEAATK